MVRLLTSALGWEDDERHTELFRWKHRSNPFGPSPAWLAEDDEGVVGFRAFMRWEFLKDGTPISAVRAVDTATETFLNKVFCRRIHGSIKLIFNHMLTHVATCYCRIRGLKLKAWLQILF